MAKSMKGVAAGAAAVFAISMASGPGIAVSSADHGGARSGPSAGHEGGPGPRGGTGRGRNSHDGDSRGGDSRDGNRHDRRHGDRPGRDRGPGGGTDGAGPGGGRGHWQGSGTPTDGWAQGGDGGGGGGVGGDDGGHDGGQTTGTTAGRGTSSVPAGRPVTATPTAVTATPTASRGGISAAAPAASAPATDGDPVDVAPPAVSPTVATPASTGGGGIASIGSPAATSLAPLAIFGDGRSPAYLAPAPAREPDVPGVAAGVAPAIAEATSPLRRELTPAAPDTIPSPTPPATMTAIPWPLEDTPVPSILRHVEPGWPAGLLFGIAGLLLAPIGGIWLGHRQARATKAASQLVGH